MAQAQSSVSSRRRGEGPQRCTSAQPQTTSCWNKRNGKINLMLHIGAAANAMEYSTNAMERPLSNTQRRPSITTPISWKTNVRLLFLCNSTNRCVHASLGGPPLSRKFHTLVRTTQNRTHA